MMNLLRAQTFQKSQSKKLEYVSWALYTPVEFLDVKDDFIFASSNALVTLDISDKKNPKEASHLRPMEAGVPASIVVHDRYAFVAWSEYGIRVADVADKRYPIIVVDSFYAGFKFSHLAVQYPYLVAMLFRSVDDVSICVIDISAPTKPAMIGEFNLRSLPNGISATHYPFQFIIEKNEVFLTCGSRGNSGSAFLHVIDVGVPSKPTLASSLDLGIVRAGQFRERPHLALVKKDSVIYITGPFIGTQLDDIKIIRTSRVAAPKVVGSWTGRINAGDIDVDGNSLFLTDRNSRLIKLDISDPLAPVFVDSIRMPVPSYYSLDFQVRAEGGYAYMHMWDFYAIIIVDATSASLSVVSEIPFGHALNDISASGSYLFTSVWDCYQLYVLNMSKPESPRIANRIEALGYGWGNDVKGSYAYLAMGDNTISNQTGGLHIYDVSDPERPVFRGHNPTHNPGTLHDVDVYVDTTRMRAYVAIGESKNWEDGMHSSDSGGVRIVDVRDPTNPVTLGVLLLGPNEQGKAIYAIDDVAYLGTSAGLYIIDVSKPAQPRVVSVWGPGKKGARGLTKVGRYLLVAYANTLSLLDVSDPTAPVHLGSHNLHTQVNDVAFDSARVYAVTHDGLYVFDASDLRSPRMIDSVRNIFASSPQFLALGNGHIYVATNSGGIYTFRLTDVTDIEEVHRTTPSFELHQNYPNPFAQSTVIGYRLPASGHVRLEVFDVLGRKIATLVNGERDAGEHTVQYEIGNFTSANLRSEFEYYAGVYFYRMTIPNHVEMKKMIVVDR